MADKLENQVMGTVDINFLPGILSAKQMALTLDQLSAQLRATQGIARQIGPVFLSDMARSMQQQNVIYGQYGQVLVDLDAKNKALTKGVKTIDQEAKKHKQTIQDLSNQYNVLGSQFERRAGWFIAGSAFFGGIAAVKETVSTISEVQMGMTQIGRVTEDATFNVASMRKELFDLGQTYGMVWEDVQDIALRWAQTGYNVQDTIELTKTSLLALNTAELDAKNATESMVGIMAQWGLQAKDLLSVIDKINKTADDYTVTSQDLVDGLLRSSGAAKIMGLSLEETISLLTVMREASGRTGREVGNALNSILSYIQRPSAINALEGLGIQVFADAAKTQFRNVMLIFQDIAAKWPALSKEIQDAFVAAADEAGLYSEELANAIGIQDKWNDLQQRDIAQSAAGVYRRNYFIGMIERLTNSQGVLNNMMDASGYSMRENERTMETLEKQYNALKAAAQELAVEIGEAGLLNDLTGLVKGTREAIEAFNDLDDSSKRLLITFVEVAAALKIIRSLLGMAGLAGGAKLLTGWVVPIAASGAAIRSLASAGTLLVTVLRNVGAAGLRLFGGPWGLALTTAVTGLIAFNRHMNAQAQQAEEAYKSLEPLSQQYEEINAKISNTNVGTAEYAELNKQLTEVMNSIAEIMPELTLAWDAQGNAIALNNDKLREYIDLAKQSKVAAASESLGDAVARKLNIEKQIAAEMAKEIAPEEASRIGAWVGGFRDQNRIAELNKELEKVNAEVNKYSEMVAGGALDLGINRPEVTIPAATNQTSGGSTGGGDKSKKLSEITSDFIKDTLALSTAQGYLNEGVQRGINLTQARIEYYSREGATMEDLQNGMEEQIHLIALYEEKQEGISQEADALREAITQLETRQASLNTSTEEGKDAYDNLTQEIENCRTQVGDLQEEWWQLELQQKEVGKSTEELQKKYKDLIDQELGRIEEAKDKRITAIEEEADARVKAIQAEIDALEGQKSDAEEEDELQKHNQKIADLQEERQYHELRTGREHQEEIKRINEEIAQENLDWQKKLNDDLIDEQVKEKEDEIDVIQDGAKDKKKAVEDEYAILKEAIDAGLSDNLSLLSVYEPKYYEEFYNLTQQIIEGWEAGDPISTIMEDVARLGSISSDTRNPDAIIRQMKKNSKAWWDASTEERKDLEKENRALGKSIGLTYDDDTGIWYWPNGARAYHKGGIAGSIPVAHNGFLAPDEELSILKRQEMVLPEDISKSIQYMTKAVAPAISGAGTSMPGFSFFETLADRIVNKLAAVGGNVSIGTLFNAENVGFEDEADMDIFARKMGRAVRSLSVAKGVSRA